MADIVKNTDEKRYEYHRDGEVVGYVDYVVDTGVIVLPHTFVEPAHRGGDVASELVRHALDDIRSEGYKVEPTCPYVARWIDKHGDYADLVADRRGRDTDDVASDAAQVAGVDLNADRRV